MPQALGVQDLSFQLKAYLILRNTYFVNQVETSRIYPKLYFLNKRDKFQDERAAVKTLAAF